MIEEIGLVSHYSTANSLNKILGNGTIRLGSVCDLDDPRESDMSWVEIEEIGHTSDTENWQNANMLKENLSRQLRLFCTAMPQEVSTGACPIETSIYGRPRMWSQYAERFNGGCLIFDQARLHKAIKSSLDSEKDLVIHDSIKYYDWLHIVGGGATIQIGGKLKPSEDEVLNIINHNSMLHSIYFKKGIDWSEEIEYRWLIFSASFEQKMVNIKDSIHSVVLGSKFPIDKYKEIEVYCKNLNCSCYVLSYSHPKYKLIELYKA
jgi:Protein of unknown function (DUF2971)